MKAAITYIRKELKGIYDKRETDQLIQLIFEKQKGYTHAQLIMAHDQILSDKEFKTIEKIVERLKKHEPIQYILEETEFYGLHFRVERGVLIPRPETEELVQWIIHDNSCLRPTIIDVGTGSGCIAISIAKNLPEANVLACDISPVCIETAQYNANKNQENILVFEYDILNHKADFTIPDLDILVSNPPYVRESEKISMRKNVLDYEPELALFVRDNDPLEFYQHIARFAMRHLKINGLLYFEINEVTGNECIALLENSGFVEILLKKDINGKDRMIRARKK
jgi:release factor glutamine methyltransferase